MENKGITFSTKVEKIKKGDGIKTQSYLSHIHYGFRHNYPTFKIFSDFFNIIYQNEEKRKLYGISNLSFLSYSRFTQDISLGENTGLMNIVFKYKDLQLCMGFEKYKECGEFHYSIDVSSVEKTQIIGDHIYKLLFDSALQESDLKGKFIEMPMNKFDWTVRDIEKRTFGDIYLPNDVMDDIKLFYNVFSGNGKFLRYLMVGNPGTGKTESTLVLANELNKLGVTIIKTSVDNLFKEKIELAEVLKPSIVISDDIDLSLGSRNNGVFSERLGIFLDVLDGTNKLSKGVGFLCATNSASFLDLAAQRPGRFDKVVLFDRITKDNVKNIILKSLRFNFNINGTHEITKILTNNSIIKKYYDAKVTGAHIYNSVNMIKTKMDSIKQEPQLKWISEEIDNEIKLIERIKKQTKLSNKLNNESSGIGFKHYDDEPEVCEEICSPEGGNW